jgi:hypothetical protein
MHKPTFWMTLFAYLVLMASLIYCLLGLPITSG